MRYRAIGEFLKRKGLKQVEANNQRFVTVMRTIAVLHAIRCNSTVSSDALREYAHEAGVTPSHPNAWGAVFRHKNFGPAGFKVSEWPSNHARIIRRWLWTGPRGDSWDTESEHVFRNSKWPWVDTRTLGLD